MSNPGTSQVALVCDDGDEMDLKRFICGDGCGRKVREKAEVMKDGEDYRKIR